MGFCRCFRPAAVGSSRPRRALVWGRFVFLLLCLPHFARAAEPISPTPNQQKSLDLRLPEYLNLVLQKNEALQAAMLDAESYRHKAKAEYGAFEPELALSAERDSTRRQNNLQQQSELQGLRIFNEENRLYDGAIESLVPSGAKIRLGSTLGDLHNNLPFFPTNSLTNVFFPHQYQSFVGITLTQPLLKNAGPAATLANVRLAALDSDIAFQQYRRQLMLIISQAEAAYWNLYYAQEQLHFFDESVAVAESILHDSQERFKAGRSAELDVLEAQSGLAVRRTKQNTALQNWYEALGRVQTLYAATPDVAAPKIHATDVPPSSHEKITYGKTLQNSVELNPDYLIQIEKLNQERVRLGFARNQLLPELNVKGSYGYSGLGLTAEDSYDNLTSQEFPAWTVGVELRIPLAGSIRGRNNFSAAKLAVQEAEVNLSAVQTQLANALNTALQKVRGWERSIDSYETVVRFNENLLKTEIARLEVGKVEARKVLEVEADLFDARQSYADALVQYRRALLELELADGSLLQSREMDVNKEALRRQTTAMLSSHRLPQGQFSPLPETPNRVAD